MAKPSEMAKEPIDLERLIGVDTTAIARLLSSAHRSAHRQNLLLFL